MELVIARCNRALTVLEASLVYIPGRVAPKIANDLEMSRRALLCLHQFYKSGYIDQETFVGLVRLRNRKFLTIPGVTNEECFLDFLTMENLLSDSEQVRLVSTHMKAKETLHFVKAVVPYPILKLAYMQHYSHNMDAPSVLYYTKMFVIHLSFWNDSEFWIALFRALPNHVKAITKFCNLIGSHAPNFYHFNKTILKGQYFLKTKNHLLLYEAHRQFESTLTEDQWEKLSILSDFRVKHLNAIQQNAYAYLYRGPYDE